MTNECPIYHKVRNTKASLANFCVRQSSIPFVKVVLETLKNITLLLKGQWSSIASNQKSLGFLVTSSLGFGKGDFERSTILFTVAFVMF